MAEQPLTGAALSQQWLVWLCALGGLTAPLSRTLPTNHVPWLQWLVELLIRPCEVLSRVANVTILEVANNALRVLLQHRHVIIGSLA